MEAEEDNLYDDYNFYCRQKKEATLLQIASGGLPQLPTKDFFNLTLVDWRI